MNSVSFLTSHSVLLVMKGLLQRSNEELAAEAGARQLQTLEELKRAKRKDAVIAEEKAMRAILTWRLPQRWADAYEKWKSDRSPERRGTVVLIPQLVPAAAQRSLEIYGLNGGKLSPHHSSSDDGISVVSTATSHSRRGLTSTAGSSLFSVPAGSRSNSPTDIPILELPPSHVHSIETASDINFSTLPCCQYLSAFPTQLLSAVDGEQTEIEGFLNTVEAIIAEFATFSTLESQERRSIHRAAVRTRTPVNGRSGRPPLRAPPHAGPGQPAQKSANVVSAQLVTLTTVAEAELVYRGSSASSKGSDRATGKHQEVIVANRVRQSDTSNSHTQQGPADSSSTARREHISDAQGEPVHSKANDDVKRINTSESRVDQPAAEGKTSSHPTGDHSPAPRADKVALGNTEAEQGCSTATPKDRPRTSSVKHLWDQVPPDSPFRKFLPDSVTLTPSTSTRAQEHQADIESLQAVIDLLLQNCVDAEVKVDHLTVVVGKMEIENADMQRQLSDARGKEEELRARVIDYQAHLTASEEREEVLHRSYLGVKEDADRLVAQLANARDDASVAKRQLDQERRTKVVLVTQVGDLREENEGCHRRIRELENELKSLQQFSAGKTGATVAAKPPEEGKRDEQKQSTDAAADGPTADAPAQVDAANEAAPPKHRRSRSHIADSDGEPQLYYSAESIDRDAESPRSRVPEPHH